MQLASKRRYVDFATGTPADLAGPAAFPADDEARTRGNVTAWCFLPRSAAAVRPARGLSSHVAVVPYRVSKKTTCGTLETWPGQHHLMAGAGDAEDI